MNQITKQIKDNEDNFGQKYPAVQCVTPGREFTSDIPSVRQSEIISYLHSSQISLLKAIREAITDLIGVSDEHASVDWFNGLRACRSLLDEAIKENE